jgi:NADPH:quinone reductase-like Zn-dependent oxidoreductase
MQAWRIHEYGGPERLLRETVPRPVAGAGEVVLRVHAASVNPIDWKIREGLLRGVLPMTLPVTLGRDAVGEVIEVGPGVGHLHEGDRVLGVAAVGRDGTHAEFCALPASGSAAVPQGVSDEAAVCLGVAGLSAWIPLVEMANVGPGMRVLVHAGAGGVGGLAVQLAKARGAWVAATASAANLEYVTSLGADLAIDYAGDGLARLGATIDVALDTMGGDVHARTLDVIRPGGRVVALAAAPLPPNHRADVQVELARIAATTERLARLLALAAERRIKPQVGRTFPLAEAQAAYAASRTGHVRGKLILLA